MNPHLPPDEAIVAALVLMLMVFGALWFLEFWR